MVSGGTVVDGTDSIHRKLRLLVLASWLLSPFQAVRFWTGIGDSGVALCFPLWVLQYGSGEAGPFVRIGPSWDPFMPPFAIISAAVCLCIALILALWVGSADNMLRPMNTAIVFVLSFLVHTLAIMTVNLSRTDESWDFYGTLIPLPITTVVALIGASAVYKKQS